METLQHVKFTLSMWDMKALLEELQPLIVRPDGEENEFDELDSLYWDLLYHYRKAEKEYKIYLKWCKSVPEEDLF